jgi:hypothetical protein
MSNVGKDVKLLASNINNLMIQYSDQQIACEDLNKIKQFSTRTQTLSGLYNLAFTIGTGILSAFSYQVADLSPTALEIGEAFTSLYNGWYYDNASFTCHTLGFYLAKIMAISLSAFTDDEVYFTEVMKYN